MSELVAVTSKLPPLVPVGGRNAKHRLGAFLAWQSGRGGHWYDPPDLAAYRDHLLTIYSPPSARAHLSTVRAAYRRMVTDNGTRDLVELEVRIEAEREQKDLTPADVEALVNRTLQRLANAIEPEASSVKVAVVQDRVDSEALRLTPEQAGALLASPGTATIRGLRDTATIGMLLCTGIREAELCGLDVADLRQKIGGELCLHVREGKGNKTRAVPYGALDWVVVLVQAWLDAAGIVDGPVFRGFWKGGQTVRPDRLSVRAVGDILGAHPVTIEGKLRIARPHDLRRTFAAIQYAAGVDLEAIRQNLGHARIETTLAYIGPLDAQKRRGRAVIPFDLSALYKQGELEVGE